MQDQMRKQFGSDIMDKIDAWYAFENPNDKDMYLRNHPEVQDAMDFKAGQVADTPILAAYYDGLGNIENYWAGEKRKDVLAKLGADYFDLLKQRELMFTKSEIAAFDRAHPQLKKYSALSKKWEAFIQRKILDYGKTLPVGKSSVLQNADMTSTGQQAISQSLTPAPKVKWQDIAYMVPDSLKSAIGEYIQNDKPISATQKTVLNRVAKSLDLTADELLAAAFAAMP